MRGDFRLTREQRDGLRHANSMNALFPEVERLVAEQLEAARAGVAPANDWRLAMEIDRNARAYGWSVGRGHPLTPQIEDVDPENPFLDPNWRDAFVRGGDS